MKKLELMILVFIILLGLVGCGKKNDKPSEETTSQNEINDETSSEDEYDSYEVILEEPSKVVLATSLDSEITESSTEDNNSATDAEAELPDVMEPLDNDYKCNPRITNLSLMKAKDFNRERLLDAILDYMYLIGISDDILEEIHVDENNSQGTRGYKMTLKFKKSSDQEVTVFWYNKNYYDIQAYVDDDDVGFDINN